MPPYKVGDEVLVIGQWLHASPHGESNTEGLLVYQSINNITQNWQSPAPVEIGSTIAPPKH